MQLCASGKSRREAMNAGAHIQRGAMEGVLGAAGAAAAQKAGMPGGQAGGGGSGTSPRNNSPLLTPTRRADSPARMDAFEQMAKGQAGLAADFKKNQEEQQKKEDAKEKRDNEKMDERDDKINNAAEKRAATAADKQDERDVKRQKHEREIQTDARDGMKAAAAEFSVSITAVLQAQLEAQASTAAAQAQSAEAAAASQKLQTEAMMAQTAASNAQTAALMALIGKQ